MVIRNAGDMKLSTTPPHDISDKNSIDYAPTGNGAEKLIEIMKRAKDKVFNGSYSLYFFKPSKITGIIWLSISSIALTFSLMLPK